MKPVIFLIMSVGPFEKNGSCKYFISIGGKDNIIVVLPKQFAKHAKSYEENGIRVYIYDEKKYINDSFEFFGFKPRNCGGIGRQGIAEAVETLDDGKTIFCQVDDDTSMFGVTIRSTVNQSGWKTRIIKNFKNLEKIINLFDEFYKATGIKIQGKTGASIMAVGDYFFSNRKIFNNFIMYPEDKLKGDGFKALCSDDVRYNLHKNLIDCTPMASTNRLVITFLQSQGDRKDGNAPLYNKDCSWKKSFANRLYNPAYAIQYIAREKNRILFRETMRYTLLYPPVYLTDKDGKITSKLIFK